MNEHRRDTVPDDRPELVGAWVDGRYYLGKVDGDEGEYLSAESTVPIEHAN
jgi:hypothetical protein